MFFGGHQGFDDVTDGEEHGGDAAGCVYGVRLLAMMLGFGFITIRGCRAVGWSWGSR